MGRGEAEGLFDPLLSQAPFTAEEMEDSQKEQQITAIEGRGERLGQGQRLLAPLVGLVWIA